MSGDSFSESETVGWGSRLGKAIGGVLVGGLMFLVAFPLIFWNEGRAVHRAQDLEEGKGAVVDVANPATVDSAANGKLVHVTGEAATKDKVADPTFNVAATGKDGKPAIALVRSVEMYQWKEDKKEETKKQLGGGEKKVTTYTYRQVWSADTPQPTSGFKVKRGHWNPSEKPYQSDHWAADTVTLGGYKLNKDQIGRIPSTEKLPVTKEMLAKVPEAARGKLEVKSDAFYLSSIPKIDKNEAADAKSDDDSTEDSSPEDSTAKIGDTRISYTVTPAQTISLIAKQVNDTFEPYPTKTGGTLDELRAGSLSAEAMFQAAAQENELLLWILRVVGFVLMAMGIYLVFKPLVVLADVIPFVGNLLSVGVGIFAVVVALPLTLITIAIGWIFYRPLVGIGLLAVALAIIFGIVYLVRGRKKAPAVGPAKA